MPTIFRRRRRMLLVCIVVATAVSATLAAVVLSTSGDNPARLPGRPALITPAADRAAAVPLPEEVDFNRDIRPILSDRCFACHGPDAAVAKDKGGFRLDQFEAATKPAASGSVPIVPGDAAGSEVVARVTSDRANQKMPPPDSHLTLTEREIELLKQWIDQGAEYQGHWAYQPPVKRPLPEIANDDWARGVIDTFIAAKLESVGLSPSGEADRATLIRRLSLDLTGLPPTPQEIDAFVADESPDAYEKLVDRLLASKHFGERMAIVWLDASRYADTNGFHHDNIRNSWPWRQWVIDAFNDNMPYDRFVVEQLAGDLLPNATREQVLASAFCRMHNINDEGGALDAEYRVEAIADRIETIATVFMAQTFTCARCHDHKYDPISQDDYYSLWAYFNSVDERGVYPNSFDEAVAYPPRMLWTTPEQDAALADAEARMADAEAKRDAQAPTVAQEQAAWEQALRDKCQVHWAQPKLTQAASSHTGTTLQVMPDRSVLLGGEVPDREDITLTLRTDATDLRLIKLDALADPSMKDNGVGRANNGNAVLTQVVVQAASIADPSQVKDVAIRYAWADFEQPNGDFDVMNTLRDDIFGWALGGHLDDRSRTALFVSDEPFGFEGGTELRITLRHQSRYSQHTLGRVRVDVASAAPCVLGEFPTVSRDWFEVGPYAASYEQAFKTRFGPEDATDTGPYGQGFGGKNWQHRPSYIDGAVNALDGEQRAFYVGRSIFTPVERRLNLSLGSDDGIQVYLNGEEVFARNVQRGAAADQEQAAITLRPGENTLVLKITNGGSVGGFYYKATSRDDSPALLQPMALVDPSLRLAEIDRLFATDWRTSNSPTYRVLNQAVESIQQEIDAINAQAVPVIIMKELDTPNPAYVLNRGAYDAPLMDRQRPRRPPLAIGEELPEGAPDNRLGFAMWLVRSDHPLTARVQVNRVWRMLFGEGLVKTVEDFGSQAEWPTHPDLLDYLAVDFVESGWDQKALVKQVVMSATYRQRAATRTEAIEIDPGNRLLSYFPRRRLAGELIRDQALSIAGLLNDEVGGPSVKPYQPGDLWREVSIGGSSNTGAFQRDSGDSLYRRSMYTFWKRTSPPPQMATFNAPTREFCVVRRDVTNTPLQVLVLWNDEQFLEAARVLAQRTLAEAGTDDARLTLIYRRCTGQAPSGRALAVLQEALAYYRERYGDAPEDAAELLKQGEYPLPDQHDPAELAAWMMIGSTVLSLDETIVRD